MEIPLLSKAVRSLQRSRTRTPIRDRRRMWSVHITTLTCVITMGVATRRPHMVRCCHMTRMQRHTTLITTITMEAIHRHTRLPPAIHTVLLQGQVTGPLPRDTHHIRPPLAMHHQATAILRRRAMVRHLQVTRLLATRRLVIHRPHIHRRRVATCHQLSPLVTLRIRRPILAINNLPLATAIHRLLNEASRRAVPRAPRIMGAMVIGEIASVGARHLQGQVAWMEADEADQACKGNTTTSECLGSCRLQNFAAAIAAGCGCCCCCLSDVATHNFWSFSAKDRSRTVV